MRSPAAVSRRLTELVPLARVPDLAQIERVRPLLEGRSVAIVGSAPLSTTLAPLAGDEIAVPVNGGISSTDGVVPLWVVGSKLKDLPTASTTPLHAQMLAQAQGRAVDHVLLLRGPKIATEAATLAVFSRLGCSYQSWSVLDKPTKRWIEGELCGRRDDKQPCSSGILAAAIACWCGAARVRLVGFSLKPGYHYIKHEQPQNWWRDHVQADRRAIKALKADYAIWGDIVASVLAA